MVLCPPFLPYPFFMDSSLHWITSPRIFGQDAPKLFENAIGRGNIRP